MSGSAPQVIVNSENVCYLLNIYAFIFLFDVCACAFVRASVRECEATARGGCLLVTVHTKY